MDKRYTSITVTRETSAKLRKLAIDEGLRMNVLLHKLIDFYQSQKKQNMIDDDLKEMSKKQKSH